MFDFEVKRQRFSVVFFLLLLKMVAHAKAGFECAIADVFIG